MKLPITGIAEEKQQKPKLKYVFLAKIQDLWYKINWNIRGNQKFIASLFFIYFQNQDFDFDYIKHYNH